jgi:hypothetical protein
MEEKHSLTDLELIGRHKASFKLDPYRVYELLYP